MVKPNLCDIRYKRTAATTAERGDESCDDFYDDKKRSLFFVAQNKPLMVYIY